ncbi:MAG TPA: hypothetical protein VLF89_02670 [Candidatus Saccharimonadales bacterium]|nr:hypothetical protein [Candidatus Saccharimonadales bacterium]
MKKKLISRAVLIVFILALAVVPVLLVFMPTNAKNQQVALEHDTQLLARLHQLELSITPTVSPTPTPLTKVAPPLPSITLKAKPVITLATISKPVLKATLTPKPTYVASIIQDQEVSDWKLYKSKSIVAASFSFSYPSSWNVTYKKDDSQTNAYQFRFTQDNGSQVMTIQLYAKAESTDAFINANYKNKLTAEVFNEIGNQTVYRVSPKEDLSTTDPVYTLFGSRGLILAKQHAYTLSFDANPDHAMINLIEQIIWPHLSLK